MPLTLTAADLATATGLDTATATRVLATVSEMVMRHAPDAPAAIKKEAMLRLAGWFADSPPGGQRSERVGDVSTGWVMPGRTSPMLASGAAALLSEYRVRRAGVIK